MIQQNKTDQGQTNNQNGHLSEHNLQLQQLEESQKTNNHLESQPENYDESKIQIIVPLRKSRQQSQQDQHQVIDMQIISSHEDDGKEEKCNNKQEEQQTRSLQQTPCKPTINDMSVVCIDLNSQYQTIERKPTSNSVHFSKLFSEFNNKKQDKVLIDQGIQTSVQITVHEKQIIQQQSLENYQLLQEEQLKEVNKLVQMQLVEMLSNYQGQNLEVVEDTKQEKQPHNTIAISASKQQLWPNDYPIINPKPLQNGNNQQAQLQQTPYLNMQILSVPEVRDRIITFQASQPNLQESSSIKEQQNKMIDIEEDQQTKKFLEGVNENEYDRIILELTQKITKLGEEYGKLVADDFQISPLKAFSLQKKEENEKYAEVQYEDNQAQSIQKLSIHKSYAVSIPISNNNQEKHLNPIVSAQQSNLLGQNNGQIQYEQPSSTSKHVQVSDRVQLKIKQFSSGDVSNLLAQSQTDLIDIKDLQQDRQNLQKNHNKSEEQLLSQIPVLFSSSLQQKDSLEVREDKGTLIKLPILIASQSNLAIIKESYEQLPYDRFKTIMDLGPILNKISFKEKHFPSNYSTEKQLKLYGKRLLRLLYEQPSSHILPANMLALQNDLQYYKSQQQIIYYLKSNQNFILICYFNHTIYIGEYITQGPVKQITRQGYGIQIRQSKYVYQGEFFADKKHGNGYIQFIGKNPFIFCGCFLDGFMDGYGKSMSSNGQIYLGDYKLGQRDGIGKLTYDQHKNAFYEGEFYDGFKHGKGFQIFQNGDSYSGSYSRDKFQGQGQYKWKNSTIYQGTFVEGCKHGPGLLIFANGQTFEKYYDYNKQINLQDDKKTIKSSRISTYSQNKFQQKTLIQQKPRNFRNTRSVSGQSLLSYKSRSNQKSSVKLIKDKKKIAELLKQKQMEDDLRNLDKILKDPEIDENKIKKIFSVKKLDTKEKIIGKMYHTTERPAMKISEKGELDLIKLSKIGSQRKSLVNFDSEQRLEELRESSHQRRVQRTTNFSQF